MQEPKIEVIGESKSNGPFVKAEFIFDKYKIILEIDGSKGMYSDISLMVDIKSSEVEYEDFPFYSAIKSVITEDGNLMVQTVYDKSNRIFEDLCLFLEQHISITDLNFINKYLPNIVKRLERQYKIN